MKSFHKADWTAFYGNVSEAIPNNAQKPRERRSNCTCLLTWIMQMRRFEGDQGQDFAYSLIMACVMWHTKHQATVESAGFGAEFIAMKQAMEASRGLRYNICIMGIPIVGLMYTYGDNMFMVHNTQRPESMLES